jgi:hypothetical protein
MECGKSTKISGLKNSLILQIANGVNEWPQDLACSPVGKGVISKALAEIL